MCSVEIRDREVRNDKKEKEEEKSTGHKFSHSYAGVLCCSFLKSILLNSPFLLSGVQLDVNEVYFKSDSFSLRSVTAVAYLILRNVCKWSQCPGLKWRMTIRWGGDWMKPRGACRWLKSRLRAACGLTRWCMKRTAYDQIKISNFRLCCQNKKLCTAPSTVCPKCGV